MSFNLAFAIARKRALRTSPCSNHDLPTRPRPGNRLLPFALFAASFFTAQLAYAEVPVADGQTVNINEDDAATPITLTGSDSDLDPVTFNAPNTSGLVGSLTGAVPNLSYAPPANYNGTTSFTFTVTAGGEDSPPATVTINVASINDIPVADDKPGVAVDEDDSVDITLTGSDPVEGSGLTFSIASSPSDGQISGTLPNVTYTPNPNFDGSDSQSTIHRPHQRFLTKTRLRPCCSVSILPGSSRMSTAR
jgi:hypothetical protein